MTNNKKTNSLIVDNENNFEFKSNFDDEITYLELILSLLKSLKEKPKLISKIPEAIIKSGLNGFEIEDKDIIKKALPTTITYLEKTKYVKVNNLKVHITSKGYNFIDSFFHDISQKIFDSSIEDDVDAEIIKLIQVYQLMFNDELIDKYEVPTEAMLYYPVLLYVKDESHNSPQNIFEIIFKFIKSQGYSDEQLGIISPLFREIVIYENVKTAISDLIVAGLIDKLSDNNICISNEGLKCVKSPKLVNNIVFEVNKVFDEQLDEVIDNIEKLDSSDLDNVLSQLTSINPNEEDTFYVDFNDLNCDEDELNFEKLDEDAFKQFIEKYSTNENTPKKEISENLNELQKEHVNKNLHDGIYSNIILDILSRSDTCKRHDIILTTIDILIPGYNGEKVIFKNIEKEVQKAMNDLIKCEFIKKAKKRGFYKLTKKGKEFINVLI